MTKKLIYKIHKWTGVTFGFILFLLAISGVVITFQHELMPRLYPSYFHVEAGEAHLPLETIARKTQDYLGPEKNMTNLYAAEDKDEAHMILYKDPTRSPPMLVTVNPYTGDVVGEMSLAKNVFAVMLFMHANLFLGKTGKYLVGISGFILLLFVLSGIYIWYPPNSLKQKIKRIFQFKTNVPQKLHHFMGLIFALPIAISAITGFLIIFDFGYYLGRPLNNDAHRPEEMERMGVCEKEDQFKALSLLKEDEVKNLISIHFCTKKNSLMKASFGLRDQNFLNGYKRVIIDPKTQSFVQEFDSDKDPKSWNYKRLTLFPIHTGEYLGNAGRVIALITGIGLMILYFSGIRLFLKRRKKFFQI